VPQATAAICAAIVLRDTAAQVTRVVVDCCPLSSWVVVRCRTQMTRFVVVTRGHYGEGYGNSSDKGSLW
jgi:hypothetical protein